MASSNGTIRVSTHTTRRQAGDINLLRSHKGGEGTKGDGEGLHFAWGLTSLASKSELDGLFGQLGLTGEQTNNRGTEVERKREMLSRVKECREGVIWKNGSSESGLSEK